VWWPAPGLEEANKYELNNRNEADRNEAVATRVSDGRRICGADEAGLHHVEENTSVARGVNYVSSFLTLSK
jgi:hypothetical protein